MRLLRANGGWKCEKNVTVLLKDNLSPSFLPFFLTQAPHLAPMAILILLFLVAPFCIFLCRSNTSVSHVLTSGWTPVVAAMAISSLGGW